MSANTSERGEIGYVIPNLTHINKNIKNKEIIL